MFRLHIDIPLDCSEEDAAKASQLVIDRVCNVLGIAPVEHVQKVQYRLGNDEDRQNKNYLIKDENNHVANRKSQVVMSAAGVISSAQKVL